MENITINKIIKFAKEEKLDNPQIISEYIVRLAAFTWWAGQNILQKEIFKMHRYLKRN